MKAKYISTHLEDWIHDFYRSLGIQTPDQIDLRHISIKLNIHLIYTDGPSFSYQQGRFKSISINKHLSKKQQREIYFHELCHILRHTGRQVMMPKAFRDLQENQANTFVLYAALPVYMLSRYKLSDPNIIPVLSDHFCVTEELVIKRLNQIKNRLIIYRCLL